MKRWISLVFIALLLPVMAFAEDSAGAALIQKIAKNQVTIVKSFPAVGNLQGFVISPKNGQGQKTVVYADKDGQYMIAGAVINGDGQNLTQNDYQKYVTDAMAPKVLSAAANTAWFAQGNPKAKHQAYVIVEPNCIACHMLHKALLPMIKSGQLYVRWIMVAFLKPDSEAKAAAILQADDPGKLLNQDENQFNLKTEQGGVAPAKNVSDSAKQKLTKNFQFMQKFGFIATPVVIYKDQAGKAQIMNGYAPGKILNQKVQEMGALN